MTIKELKECISKYKDTDEIVIDVAPSGHICGTCVGINHIHRGFDHTMGKVIITPTVPMDIWFDKCKNCKIPHNETRITSHISYDFSSTPSKYFCHVNFDDKEITSFEFNPRKKK